MKKVLYMVLALMAVFMLSLAGCGSAPEKQNSGQQNMDSSGKAAKPVKIGVLTGLTGKGADWGKKQKVALEMAQAEINAAGGINGSPVEFLINDTAGDNQQSVILTRKLTTEENVLAILGPYFSGECEVAFPQANELKVPIISATSGKPGISQANRPWTFRNSMTDDKMIDAALPLFLKATNAQKFALVVDMKDAISKSFGTAVLPASLKKQTGVTILNEKEPITYNTGDIDFSAQVTKIKQQKPDAVGIGGLYQEVASVAKEMQRQGVKIPAIGNVGMYAEALITQGGSAVEGWVALSNFWPDSPDPQTQDFIKRFKAAATKAGMENPMPDSFAASMYDTAMITVDIMKREKINGQTPVEEAREKIKNGWAAVKDYQGVMGKTAINEVGDGIKEVYALIVKNGKWERLQ